MTLNVKIGYKLYLHHFLKYSLNFLLFHRLDVEGAIMVTETFEKLKSLANFVSNLMHFAQSKCKRGTCMHIRIDPHSDQNILASNFCPVMSFLCIHSFCKILRIFFVIGIYCMSYDILMGFLLH